MASLLPGIFIYITALNAHVSVSSVELASQIRFDQRLDTKLPLETDFVDESGKKVKLGFYFDESPVIIFFGYYTCKNLCTSVYEGLIRTMNEVRLSSGSEYKIVGISIDPSNSPKDARNLKKRFEALYAGSNNKNDWYFLTGNENNIKRVANAAGSGFVYDPKKQEYLHAAGIIIATADGIISKYFYGAGFNPGHIRLGLVEASKGVVGTAVDQILLRCFHYDPVTGKYSLIVITLLRWMGMVTIFSMVATISLFLFREHKKSGRDQ